MGTTGQRRTWMAEVRCLVDDVPLTPFMRAALAPTSPARSPTPATRDWAYINSDATLPVGDWIGLEVVNHGATEASP